MPLNKVDHGQKNVKSPIWVKGFRSPNYSFSSEIRINSVTRTTMGFRNHECVLPEIGLSKIREVTRSSQNQVTTLPLLELAGRHYSKIIIR